LALAIIALRELVGGPIPPVHAGQTFRVEFLQAGDVAVPLSMVTDALSVLMLVVVTSLSALIQIFSIGYMRGDSRMHWFFAVMALFTAAMLGLVLANNLLILYVAWELVGLCSYLLIGYWWERPAAREAAKKAFVTTRIGDVGFLIGLLVLFVHTGTWEIDQNFALLAAGKLDAPVVTAVAVLVFLGAMGKSGQVPLHVWLPDAMEGPTPVSALIHAATMVAAGVYLVARMFPFFAASPAAALVVLVIGTITAILAASLALVQTDIKRVLAYSTVSQLGTMMFALGAGGVGAAMLHLTAHAFFKALLFLGAGSVIHGTQATQDLRQLGGLRQRMPMTAATFIVAALSLAGFPFFSGFWSKDAVLNVTAENGQWVTFAIGVLTAGFTAFYMFRVTLLTFFGTPRSEGARHAHESPWVMTGPLALIAVFALLAGWVGSPLVGDPFARFFFLGEAHEPAFQAWVAVLGGALALGGLGLAIVCYGVRPGAPAVVRARLPRLTRALERKLYFDDVYQWGIDHLALAFGRFIAAFDRSVVNDTGVDGTGKTVLISGRVLRLFATGRVYTYGWFIALGVVVLGIAAALGS
ncbi:MAG: NADH-quinone oxidoreductase subunit L, partial [Actinobacteria bacterium]|nr:NADH-quinone oxidoreductase subunit L [Actinomycetota bacterium]